VRGERLVEVGVELALRVVADLSSCSSRERAAGGTTSGPNASTVRISARREGLSGDGEPSVFDDTGFLS
jgi:hypothetical protein